MQSSKGRAGGYTDFHALRNAMNIKPSVRLMSESPLMLCLRSWTLLE
jgi:hypothetical protein